MNLEGKEEHFCKTESNNINNCVSIMWGCFEAVGNGARYKKDGIMEEHAPKEFLKTSSRMVKSGTNMFF